MMKASPTDGIMLEQMMKAPPTDGTCKMEKSYRDNFEPSSSKSKNVGHGSHHSHWESGVERGHATKLRENIMPKELEVFDKARRRRLSKHFMKDSQKDSCNDDEDMSRNANSLSAATWHGPQRGGKTTSNGATSGLRRSIRKDISQGSNLMSSSTTEIDNSFLPQASWHGPGINPTSNRRNSRRSLMQDCSLDKGSWHGTGPTITATMEPSSGHMSRRHRTSSLSRPRSQRSSRRLQEGESLLQSCSMHSVQSSGEESFWGDDSCDGSFDDDGFAFDDGVFSQDKSQTSKKTKKKKSDKKSSTTTSNTSKSRSSSSRKNSTEQEGGSNLNGTPSSGTIDQDTNCHEESSLETKKAIKKRSKSKDRASKRKSSRDLTTTLGTSHHGMVSDDEPITTSVQVELKSTTVESCTSKSRRSRSRDRRPSSRKLGNPTMEDSQHGVIADPVGIKDETKYNSSEKKARRRSRSSTRRSKSADPGPILENEQLDTSPSEEHHETKQRPASSEGHHKKKEGVTTEEGRGDKSESSKSRRSSSKDPSSSSKDRRSMRRLKSERTMGAEDKGHGDTLNKDSSSTRRSRSKHRSKSQDRTASTRRSKEICDTNLDPFIEDKNGAETDSQQHSSSNAHLCTSNGMEDKNPMTEKGRNGDTLVSRNMPVDEAKTISHNNDHSSFNDTSYIWDEADPFPSTLLGVQDTTKPKTKITRSHSLDFDTSFAVATASKKPIKRTHSTSCSSLDLNDDAFLSPVIGPFSTRKLSVSNRDFSAAQRVSVTDKSAHQRNTSVVEEVGENNVCNESSGKSRRRLSMTAKTPAKPQQESETKDKVDALEKHEPDTTTKEVGENNVCNENTVKSRRRLSMTAKTPAKPQQESETKDKVDALEKHEPDTTTEKPKRAGLFKFSSILHFENDDWAGTEHPPNTQKTETTRTKSSQKPAARSESRRGALFKLSSIMDFGKDEWDTKLAEKKVDTNKALKVAKKSAGKVERGGLSKAISWKDPVGLPNDVPQPDLHSGSNSKNRQTVSAPSTDNDGHAGKEGKFAFGSIRGPRRPSKKIKFKSKEEMEQARRKSTADKKAAETIRRDENKPTDPTMTKKHSKWNALRSAKDFLRETKKKRHTHSKDDKTASMSTNRSNDGNGDIDRFLDSGGKATNTNSRDGGGDPKFPILELSSMDPSLVSPLAHDPDDDDDDDGGASPIGLKNQSEKVTFPML